ncbi:MAG: phosphoribosylformylglycinamidine synthase, partial [Lachnospiraceae bacterium]|nr:phosphoribosylformylglycinamidine synthase [Lachnospiraceae bacterium]
MSLVRRVYVEKKPEYDNASEALRKELKTFVGIANVEKVRILNRYDVSDISDETWQKALSGVFAEAPVDNYYLENFGKSDDDKIFSVEYLPGQFDQRADSAVQCIQFINEKENPIVKTATTYIISGNISDDDLQAIEKDIINPVDSRIAKEEKPNTLNMDFTVPDDIKIFGGFITLNEKDLNELYMSLNLAMTFEDFKFIQNYFANDEKRNPTMTEIRVLDTYWSDHCRHTTFSTELKNVFFDDGDYKERIEGTYQEYLNTHNHIFSNRDDKFVCLMDLALLAMR